jgi:hypothetical protein
MTKYEVCEVAVGSDASISPKDIIIGTTVKSGTIYLVYLKIKQGARV